MSKKIDWMVKVALLSGLAAIVMLFEFPLPFAPSFYKLNFSEVIVLFGGFALGPLAAVCIETIKILLNLILNGTDTFFIGELSNLLMGLSFVLPASFIYKFKHTKKGAINGLVIGSLCHLIFSLPANQFIMIPAYTYFMNIPKEVIIGMGTKVNPKIVNMSTFLMWAVIPFNLIKGAASSLIVLFSYKFISPLLHKK